MLVEVTPATYLAIYGLIKDALQVPSDATPILERALRELDGIAAAGMIPSELLERPEYLENLRRAGFGGR